MKRPPAVAGRFYEAEPRKLSADIKSLVNEGAPKEGARAILCPHAGLVFSGAVAGAVYSRIKFPRTFVLLGPNHTGLGHAVSMMSGGQWEIPTGDVEIDAELAASIARNAPLVSEDEKAHEREHSLEVQLPFIVHFSREARIVPIAVLSASLDELKAIGRGIAGAVSACGYPVVIVASSDMSHFISDEDARRNDRLALDRVLALDPDGLYSVVKGKGISMCGYMPTVIMLEASRALGAGEASLVKYATSAEVSGDYQSVVGYAGVIVK